MENYYLAIDIGASSGRHILGHLKNGNIIIEEIHRFNNSMINSNGNLYWDTEKIFNEIIIGMKKCKSLEKIPISVGVDTWGVDFVLLDKNDKLVSNVFAYRDLRTNGMDIEVYKYIPEQEIYSRTGIQKMIINTLYQLMSCKKELHNTKTLLFMPDYFHFLLSGEKACEYTIASTSNILNAHTRDWDDYIIQKLNFPKDIFTKIAKPGTNLGVLTKYVQDLVGYNCRVILPASHDTASAVVASTNPLYLSSGTWSLLGIKNNMPILTEEARLSLFTNEGGFNDTYRFLKNIMGLWMMQSIKIEFKNVYSFEELTSLAEKSDIDSIVPVNDPCFLSPENMINAINEQCESTKQPIPKTPGEYAKIIYNSLAVCYSETISKIEKITGNTYDKLEIVGGGVKADYLNKLTAEYTKKQVIKGHAEATAIGNIIVQSNNTL